jgi:hypothetical protein
MPLPEFDVGKLQVAGITMPETMRRAAAGDMNAKRDVFAAVVFCQSIEPRSDSAKLVVTDGVQPFDRVWCQQKLFGRTFSDIEFQELGLTQIESLARSGDRDAKERYSVEVRKRYALDNLHSSPGTPENEIFLKRNALAQTFLLEAASSGSAHANAVLAGMYAWGNGVPRDSSTALQFAERAMQLGDYPNFLQSLGLSSPPR